MSPNQSRHSPAGFTIIEVLIALAIAGVILTIIFAAIPALQRNANNNRRHGDVATILDAVSSYMLNNSGNFPAQCGGSGNACTHALVAPIPPAGPNDNFLRYLKNKLTFYDGTAIYLHPQTNKGAAPTANNLPAATDTGRVDVYNYELCSGADLDQATSAGAGYSDVVALYALETSNSTLGKCQAL